MKHFGLKEKNLLGSIAIRVFFICIFLFVVPLFIHTIILYKHAHEAKINDFVISLKTISKSISTRIDRNLKIQSDILTLIEDHIDFTKPRNLKNTNDYLKYISKNFDLDNVFYFAKKNGTLVCQYATLKEMIGIEFSDGKYILNNKNHFFSKDLKNQKKLFYSQTIYSNNNPIGVLIIEEPYNTIIQKPADYINLSIISKDQVIATTNKDLKTIHMEKMINLPDAYALNNDQIAIITPISTTTKDLLLDVSKKYISQIEKKNYMKHIWIFISVLLIVSIGIFLVIYFMLTPLKRLYFAMTRVKEGDLSYRYERSKIGFEINIIGSFFNEMLDSIIAKQKEIEQEKLKKQRLSQELALGRKIQYDLLVKDRTFESLDVATKYIPAKEVGGDFYDIFRLDDNRIFFSIADSAGKGISACLFSLSFRSMIRSFASSLKSLDEIVINANNLFMKDSKSTEFITTWIGIYDEKTKSLEYTSCGHYPTLLIKNNKIEELQTRNVALGIEDIQKLETKTITLEKEDVLFLYTDGIIDATNASNKIFSEKRLNEFLLKTSTLSSGEITENLLKEIKDFTKDFDQFDDMTTLVLKIQ